MESSYYLPITSQKDSKSKKRLRNFDQPPCCSEDEVTKELACSKQRFEKRTKNERIVSIVKCNCKPIKDHRPRYHFNKNHSLPLSNLVTDAYDRTPLHNYLATTPSSTQNVTTAQNLIKKAGLLALMYRDFRGMTPLAYACSSHSDPQILREIIKIAPHSSTIPDLSGNLPLHHYIGCFVQEGSASAESIVILHKSNPQAVLARNNEGDIPLHILCKRWHPDNIGDALLRASAETVKIPDIQGRLPLAIACEWRVNYKLIISMCELYPEAASVKDLYGDVPLHILCRTYPEDIPEKGIFVALAKAAPKMIAIPNADGTLPIETACEWVLATSKVVLLPEERNFFHWPHFLSEYMCSLDILVCFLKADPEVATAALRFICKELETRTSGEYSHLVTALALEFLIKSLTPLYKAETSYEIPRYNGKFEFSNRRILLHAALKLDTPISFKAFEILFGPHWTDMKDLARQSVDQIDNMLPLHEASCAGERIDARIINYLLKLNPEASKQVDKFNKLPLQYAVENRLHFDGIKALFESNPSPLMETRMKKITELDLSLAAAANDSDIDVILFLLLNNPSVVKPC